MSRNHTVQNPGALVSWNGCLDITWVIIILNEPNDDVPFLLYNNEIGKVLGKHTRHGVNSSLGFVEAVIFIYHVKMVIMSNRVSMKQPNRSIAYNTKHLFCTKVFTQATYFISILISLHMKHIESTNMFYKNNTHYTK